MAHDLPPHLAALATGAPAKAPQPPQHAAARPAPDDLYETLVELRRERSACVLCTVVRASGSSPRKAGAKMLVLADGSTLGTIGGGAIEQRVIEEALETLHDGGAPRTVAHDLTRELGMCCGGSMELYLEPQLYAPELVVFGAGHVARPLVQMAALAGFDVTVVDERPLWASPEHFPAARQVLCAPPAHAIDTIAALRDTPDASYALVLTHDHGLDHEIVERLLARPLRFLGLIGSVRKRERFRQRLAALGHDDATLARLHTPMGLDIGAVTPEEIAVSVVAELVQVRRGRGGEAAAPMASLVRTRRKHGESG